MFFVVGKNAKQLSVNEWNICLKNTKNIDRENTKKCFLNEMMKIKNVKTYFALELSFMGLKELERHLNRFLIDIIMSEWSRNLNYKITWIVSGVL